MPQQCDNLSQEVLQPSRKTINVQCERSDKQRASHQSVHERGKCRFSTKPASLKHCFYVLVVLIQSAGLERKRLKSVSRTLIHLHAEIIACFLFSALLLSHLPADCTQVNDYCLLGKRHSHSNRKFIQPAKVSQHCPFCPVLRLPWIARMHLIRFESLFMGFIFISGAGGLVNHFLHVNFAY